MELGSSRSSVVLLLAALAAAVAVNVLLLGRGVPASDPLGRISPVVKLPRLAPARPPRSGARVADD